MLLGLAIVETFVLRIVAMAIGGWTVAIVLARLLSWRIQLDAAHVADLRETVDAATIKRRDVANLALIAWPNVLIGLRTPIVARRRRNISTIAHRLDDPAAFHAALARLERAHGERRDQPGT